MLSYSSLKETDPVLLRGVDILNAAFGEGYYNLEALQATCSEGFVCGAFWGFGLVGITTAYEAGTEELERDKLRAGGIESFPTTGRWVIMDSSAVVPGFRGRGIGKGLFEQRLAYAKAIGADGALAYCWNTGKDESWPIHQKLGARFLHFVSEGFYAGIPCNICDPAGRSACICGCQIMIYRFN